MALPALAALQWQHHMGVDETLLAIPIDHSALATTKTPVPPPAQPVASAAPAQPVQPASSQVEAIQHSRALADSCTTLENLRDAVQQFDKLAICHTATNTVFSDGNPEADIMFIGEAPGANEDKQGIPFCGQAGQLMDNMIATIGLSREDNCYITNTLFWRPPGNRRPTPEELAICKPFVKKHIALIQPKMIILWGGTATSTLLDPAKGITKLRGNYFSYTNEYLDKAIDMTAVFHPSYLLRQPAQKKLMWQDLLTLKHFMQEHHII